jgi:hypothetical protein
MDPLTRSHLNDELRYIADVSEVIGKPMYENRKKEIEEILSADPEEEKKEEESTSEEVHESL